MRRFIPRIKLFAVALIILIVLDWVWFSLVANTLYVSKLGLVLRLSGTQVDPNFFPAFFVYAITAISIIVYVLPRIAPDALLRAFSCGAFFGFLYYASYDLTNMAVLKEWPLSVAIGDVLWGMLTVGITTLVLHRMRE